MGKFTIVVNEKGKPHFNLIATNGQVIGTSEVYNSMASCKNGVAAVRRCSVGEIEDTTIEGAAPVKHPKFVISTDKAGKYRFNLKARNGEVILSSQGYASKDTCINGINSVKKNAPDSPIVEGE
ncbi:MAG: YegP family protein [Clostridia bacterium]|nr:YegP family protein [Clostridia bacterium]